jgi:hypothetical protein
VAVGTGMLTGALVLGAAWATVAVLPPRGTVSPTQSDDDGAGGQEAATESVTASEGERLPDGSFYVGAADESIAPVSVADGGRWIRHGKDGQCPGPAEAYTPLSDPNCLRTFDGNWATGVDEAHDRGIYARAAAISNGETTIAFAALDTVSWFYGYDPKFCPDDPAAPLPQDTCGSRAIAEDLSADLGIPASNFVIAATHTHASADTAMGSPSWYFELVRDATKTAITKAVENMQLATLETGAVSAKAFNVDRRIITRAVPDYEMTWLRAVAAPPAGGDPGPVPARETISTLVNYSVHTTVTAGNKDIHSGFVGHLAERLNDEWGGNTVFIPGGLGDQTVNRGFGRDGHGYGLAELVLESSEQTGYTLRSNDIVTEQRIITVPADNLSLVGANKAGVFVRDTTIPGDHAHGPSTSVQRKENARTPSCTGSSPISAKAPVGGFVIGTPGSGDPKNDPTGYQGDAIAIMQAPGEIFASISLVTKDYMSRTRNVMVMGMANDHLGYIIPAEQYDIRSANAAGIAQPGIETFNYEESLSTGRCTGDQVQNTLIEIGESLGIMGLGEEGAGEGPTKLEP